jgi:formylglycine-generating enzyme required for sulfatase activity
VLKDAQQRQIVLADIQGVEFSLASSASRQVAIPIQGFVYNFRFAVHPTAQADNSALASTFSQILSTVKFDAAELSKLANTTPIRPTIPPGWTPNLLRPTLSSPLSTPSAAAPTSSSTRTATPRSVPIGIKGEERDFGGAPMVFVPAGVFTMGYNGPEAQAAEKPEHQVYLDAFWIDKYEVSIRLYKVCGGAGRRCPVVPPPPLNWKPDYFDDDRYQERPVFNVTWADAEAYCESVDKRLPTEAEWEMAARGTDKRKYPWGNDFNLSCAQYGRGDKYAGNQPNNYSEVKSNNFDYCATPYGTFNMAGNVWEWVADWYDENAYRNPQSNNPVGPQSGQLHIARGGSAANRPELLRTTLRLALAKDFYQEDIGFRCAK